MYWKGIKKEFSNDQKDDIRYLIALKNTFKPNSDYKEDLQSIINNNSYRDINLN
jgi:hypothetical protein